MCLTAGTTGGAVRRARAAGCNGIDGVEVGDDRAARCGVSFLGGAPHELDPGQHPRRRRAADHRHPWSACVRASLDDPDLRTTSMSRVEPTRATPPRYTLCLVDADRRRRPGCSTGSTPLLPAAASPSRRLPDDLDCAAGLLCRPAGARRSRRSTTWPRTTRASGSSIAGPARADRAGLDRAARAGPRVTLVELLAYVADHLSYYQDAVATEAYLGTARQRMSVRRHARLVDYPMHDGCNARTWVHVEVKQAVSFDPARHLPSSPAPEGGRCRRWSAWPRELAGVPESATWSSSRSARNATLAGCPMPATGSLWTWGDQERACRRRHQRDPAGRRPAGKRER